MVARFFLFAACSLVLFIMGVFATFKANLLLYGADAFEGDSGSGFAVLVEGIVVGLFLAVLETLAWIILDKRIIRRLRD